MGGRLRWPGVGLLMVLCAGGAHSEESPQVCGTFPGRGDYELALHRFHDERLRALHVSSTRRASVSQLGNIAVIEGDETLVLPANPFDLDGQAVVFEPSTTGGYRVSRIDSSLEPALGREISLSMYGSEAVDLPFSFPFYGAGRNRIYVNANGSLTFSYADYSYHTDARWFLDSLPRVAAYYAPLDPSAGGEVLVSAEPDRLVVTWSDIPQRYEENRSSFQAVLEPSGRIVVRFGKIGATSGITGVSFPGAVSGTDIVDLTTGGHGSGAIFEEFRHELLVDRVATARRFYETFPDEFDYLVLWTTFDSDMGDALAFEATVRNSIRGIGVSLFNSSTGWGSRSVLQSVLMMGNLANYPARPDERFRRSDRTTLSVVAHETGHRWLSFVRFMDGETESDALLGHGKAHWSFFQDSDASFMYGEEVVKESADRFRTVETYARFSKLDLYLMGLAPAAEVAPVMLIGDASGRDSSGEPLSAESYPERGVVIRGRGDEVLLDQIVRAEGPRDPSFEQSQRSFRQAWILLHRHGAPPTAEQLGKVEEVRAAFEGYFQAQTLGRAIVSTSLEP